MLCPVLVVGNTSRKEKKNRFAEGHFRNSRQHWLYGGTAQKSGKDEQEPQRSTQRCTCTKTGVLRVFCCGDQYKNLSTCKRNVLLKVQCCVCLLCVPRLSRISALFPCTMNNQQAQAERLLSISQSYDDDQTSEIYAVSPSVISFYFIVATPP